MKLLTDACKLYLEFSHIPYKLEHPVSTEISATKEKSQRKFLGLVALEDLLKARGHNLEEERTRERILKLRFFAPRRSRPNLPL